MENPQDFTIVDHGSVALVSAHTDAAREWWESNVEDDYRMFGMSYVVEHRYIDALVAGITDSGLTISQEDV